MQVGLKCVHFRQPIELILLSVSDNLKIAHSLWPQVLGSLFLAPKKMKNKPLFSTGYSFLDRLRNFLHKFAKLFCQFISWPKWVNSGKFMDNCWIPCQVMADMKKVYNDLIIHTGSSWADFNHGLVVRPQGCQGCQKIHKNILQINLLSYCANIQPILKKLQKTYKSH